ncbi:cytochrome P450 [Nocardia sp. NPDC004604]|uniref:cytochrome P450 n=1 Tax=Nocardia sp. NPDC004604 TaxID=3157013 RepID=UPI0033B2EB33
MNTSKCPALDLTAATTSPDLASAYAAARDLHGDVAPGVPLGGYDWWAVIGYEAVRRAALDNAHLTTSHGATIPPLKTEVAIPIELDPPNHMKYRRCLVPELRPDRVTSWRDHIRTAVDNVIDGFIESGQGDLVRIARHVPPAVIAAIMGVPDDGPMMVHLTDQINRAAMAGDREQQVAANRDLMAYLERVVTDAEGTDRTDLLSQIANATIDGSTISHEEAVAMSMTVVLAGQETTVNGISGILSILATQPDIKRTLLDQPELLATAVEEALRLESPIQMMGRTATEDHTVEGCPVAAGDKVGIVWGAANLDPAKFEEPGTFRLDRGPIPHVAFGHGAHRCVGEHLARLEMTIATEQVLARIPDFTVAGPIERGTSIAISRGVVSLPVTFTPGARSTTGAELSDGGRL